MAKILQFYVIRNQNCKPVCSYLILYGNQILQSTPSFKIMTQVVQYIFAIQLSSHKRTVRRHTVSCKLCNLVKAFPYRRRPETTFFLKKRNIAESSVSFWNPFTFPLPFCARKRVQVFFPYFLLRRVNDKDCRKKVSFLKLGFPK